MKEGRKLEYPEKTPGIRNMSALGTCLSGCK